MKDDIQIYSYIHTYTHIYDYIYMNICSFWNFCKILCVFDNIVKPRYRYRYILAGVPERIKA